MGRRGKYFTVKLTLNDGDKKRLEDRYSYWKKYEECWAYHLDEPGIIEKVVRGRGINAGNVRIKFHREDGSVYYCHADEVTIS